MFKFFIILACLSIINSADDYDKIKELRNRLLSNQFDHSVVPLDKNTQKAHVNITLLTYMGTLNEKNGIFNLEIYLVARWIDERLKWNPDDYNGINEIALRADEIWVPSFRVFNHRHGPSRILHNKDISASINSSGNAELHMLSPIESYCDVDMKDFPFDEQYCSVFIGVFSSFVDYTLPSKKISHLGIKSGWIVELDEEKSGIQKKSNFTYISLHYKLSRYGDVYFYYLFLPYISLNLFILFTFFTSIGSSKRIICLIIAIITSFYLLSFIGWEIEASSFGTPPYAVRCLSINMLMSIIFLILSTITYETIVKTKVNLPNIVCLLIQHPIISKLFLLKFTAKDVKDIDNEEHELNKTQNEPDKWELFAVFLDRIYFIIFIIIFAIYHA